MKAPGWYPSKEYPGRDQWWDGNEFTQMTRSGRHREEKPKTSDPVYMNRPRTVDELLEPKRKYKYGTDWMVFVPLVAAAFALIWVAISAHPFYSGERSVVFKESFATITSVRPKVSNFPDGRKSVSSSKCNVTAFATIDEVAYKVDIGDSCQWETDMKTPITYDPKDIEKTASHNWLPSAQRNSVYALSTLGVCLLAAGVAYWIKLPAKGYRKKPKKRARRSS